MAQIPVTISNASGQFSLSITRADNGAAITCNSGCALGSTASRTLNFTEVDGQVTYNINVTDANGCTTAGQFSYSPIDCKCPPLATSCTGTPNVARITAAIMSHSGANTYTARLINASDAVVANTTQTVPAAGLSYSVDVAHNQQYRLQLLKNGTVIQTCGPVAAANCPCTLSITVGTPTC